MSAGRRETSRPAGHVPRGPPPRRGTALPPPPPRKRLRPFGTPRSRGPRPPALSAESGGANLCYPARPSGRRVGKGSGFSGARGGGGGRLRRGCVPPGGAPPRPPAGETFGGGGGPLPPLGAGVRAPRAGGGPGGRAPCALRPRLRRALLRGGIIEPRRRGPALAAEARPERGAQEPRPAPRAFVRPPPAARRPHGARRAEEGPAAAAAARRPLAAGRPR